MVVVKFKQMLGLSQDQQELYLRLQQLGSLEAIEEYLSTVDSYQEMVDIKGLLTLMLYSRIDQTVKTEQDCVQVNQQLGALFKS